MSDRDKSDRPPAPARLQVRVEIAPEYELLDAGKSTAYRSLRRAAISVIDVNGVVILSAVAVPDEAIGEMISTAIDRWRATP